VYSLAHESFILFPRHLGPGLYDQIVSFCKQANFSPKVMQEAIQMQTIIDLSRNGLPCSSFAAKSATSWCCLQTAQEATPQVETAVVWQPDNTSSVYANLKVVRLYVE